MKRLAMLTVLCLFLAGSALADSLPIWHRPGNGSNAAPYETVQTTEDAPFEEGAELLQVDILGIRQGDCIVITCGGKRMLVDGGENEPARRQVVDAYLEKNGITYFDYFFLTHAHDDHLEMQQRLIRRGVTAGELVSPYSEEDSYTLWNDYKRQLKEAGIPLHKIVTGDTLEIGGATLTFYRWEAKGITMNNHSACAMLQFGEARMFLAADIGGEAQHWLLDTFGAEPFKCDVYKTAHHNRTATVPEFLDALDPGLAINTNTRSGTRTGENQQDRRDIPRYYISTGTIHLSTDGREWYVWQEPVQ